MYYTVIQTLIDKQQLTYKKTMSISFSILVSLKSSSIIFTIQIVISIQNETQTSILYQKQKYDSNKHKSRV